MGTSFKIKKSQLAQIIQESINNHFSNTKLIHVVSPKRLQQGQNIVDLCRMVYHNGLECHYGVEAGNCIWFFADEPFYKENCRRFIVSLDYTPENKELFEITMQYPSAWAHKNIPFKYLKVESAPWMVNNISEGYYNKLDNEAFSYYESRLAYLSERNFETVRKDSFPWTVFTDVLPEEYLNLIPKNDNRFIFDKLFR